MCSSPVSTASSFDAQLLQETFDNAIEETCRSFGLFSPFQNTLQRDVPVEPENGTSPVVETPPTHDSASPMLTADQINSMTYEGAISKERLKKFPKSYYHVQEMNKGPVDFAPRLAQVPSQYQLESLTEMYVCDFPKLYKSAKGEEMDLEGMAAQLISRSSYVPFTSPPQSHCESTGADMHAVQSEYVSEMLY